MQEEGIVEEVEVEENKNNSQVLHQVDGVEKRAASRDASRWSCRSCRS